MVLGDSQASLMSDSGGKRDEIPLAIDLDGTLIETDLLVETAFEYLGREPQGVFNLFVWLSKGRANLKRELARRSQVDVALLPYSPSVLEYIREARRIGRKVYLASASDGHLVEKIALHLELDGWFASDGTLNLSGRHKLARLTTEFGHQEFDYLGNSTDDLPVWQGARRAVIVGSRSMSERVKISNSDYEVLSSRTFQPRAWLRLLRPHQWAKNTLVFIPLLASHLFNGTTVLQSLGAFVSFCLCASGVYVLNDLVDIHADRKHPTKKNRPLASGTVSLQAAIILAPILIALAFLLAFRISHLFVLVLALYTAITASYSFFLKQKMLLDVVTLALLYTIRVIAGAAAIDVAASQWLLGFSSFLFLSLALIKRYSEMALRFDLSLPDPENRAYRASDLPILSALAAAAGFSAVVVFCLYLSSDVVSSLYHRPNVLWLACPLLIYWISRMLLLSHRRFIDDDPVVFALRDRTSLATIILIGLLGVLAI